MRVIVKIDNGQIRCESRIFANEEQADIWIEAMVSAHGMTSKDGIEKEEVADAPRTTDAVEAVESFEAETNGSEPADVRGGEQADEEIEGDGTDI